MRVQIAQVAAVLYHLTMNAVYVENQEETGLNANLMRSGAIYIVLVSKSTLTSKFFFANKTFLKNTTFNKVASQQLWEMA